MPLYPTTATDNFRRSSVSSTTIVSTFSLGRDYPARKDLL